MVTFIKLFIFIILIMDSIIYSMFFNLYFIFVSFLLLIGFVFYIFKLKQKNKSVIDIKGWSLGAGLELTNPNNPQIIKNVILSEKSLNLGMLVLGSPGSGKTESMAIGYHYFLSQYYSCDGYSYFEGKGDIDIYMKHIASGIKFDHFFSSELEGSDTINLFEGESEDVIDRLSRLLIGETSSTSFYSDAQRAILSSVIPLMLNIGQPVNLRDLWSILAIDAAGRELIALAREKEIDDFSFRMADEYFSVKWEDRIKEVKGLLNRLMIFCVGKKTDRINCYQPDINLEEAITNNKKLYFHLPLSEYTRDLAVAIIETYGVIARNRQAVGPTQFNYHRMELDDWGAFFHSNFGPISARCRSAKMPLTFMFQSRGQLQTVGSTFETELDDTIATKIIFRTMGSSTGDLGVELLGEYEELEVGKSENSGKNGTNTHAIKHFRIEKRDLKELNPGEAYVSTLLERNGLTKNPLYKTRFPLPDLNDWESVSMPSNREYKIGEGLHMWTRHMQPSVMKAIDEALKKEDHEGLEELTE